MNNCNGDEIKRIDICVIGGGIVGMFFASRCLTSGLSVFIVENNNDFGGQMNLYQDKIIYNIPFINEIKSKDVISNIKKQINNCDNFDVEFNSSIIELRKSENVFFIKISAKNTLKTIECKYLVLATGKGYLCPNKIQIPRANEIEGKVLFYNLDNIERFHKKNIVIIGGGDSVIDSACELFNIANNIVVVHRREINRHENCRFLYFENLCNSNKITLKTHYNVSDFLFKNDHCCGIAIEKDKIHEDIYCDYILVFYGLKSIQNNYDMYQKIGINFNKDGFLVNYVNNETDCKNVFAIGDCCFFNGKIKNISAGTADALRCYYEICSREYNKIDAYEHKN